MKLNTHSNNKYIGTHSILSASQYAWIRYSDEQLIEKYYTRTAAQKGTEIHALAASLINNKIKLPRNTKTLNTYVNDAIGFKMTPEQFLYVWDCFYGTADAISFKKNILRIHDLKTGKGKVSMDQLYIYASMFCLEYGIMPNDIQILLRIYINDMVEEVEANSEDIFTIMDKARRFHTIIEELKMKEE